MQVEVVDELEDLFGYWVGVVEAFRRGAGDGEGGSDVILHGMDW